MQKHGGIWLALLLALLAAAVLAPVAAMASGTGDVAINENNFPDEKFRAYVQQFDTDHSGSLSSDEIAVVTQIDVQGRGISNLTGIEHFTALKQLTCHGNALTSLDVSQNTALTYLHCSGNQLTSLDVSQNTALTYLNCSSNRLTTLDVSDCTALTYLNCSSNRLTTLDASDCTALEYLYCYQNQLTSLDVSQNTALTSLDCNSNQLTALDVSQNTALKQLTCYKNRLTSLDVSQNTALTYLNCCNNDLTSLNVSGCTDLETLMCYNNQLTSLDVSDCTALTSLDCNNNDLTSLDVSQNTKLWSLNCSNNQLASLDVSDCTALEYLYCTRQTAQLEVDRGADGTWSANLAELIGPNVSNVATTTPDAAVQGTTATWRDSGVQPTVTYDYNTGHNNQTMSVTLTLVPLGMGTEADVTGASVKNIAGVISGTEITVKLPAGSPLPAAGDIAVTLSPYAAMTTAPASTDGGHTWTFTVTSEDGKTVKQYTLHIVYGVTVESGEDGHGTVTASPNPARMGDTVTLTVTPDPGYMLTGWEVVLGGVTVREDNTFVMPSGAVILRPVFAPIPAAPPQTGDNSHTGLWLMLLLASLGGLCAAACAARRRRGSGAR